MKRRTVSCLFSVAAVLVYASLAVAGPIPLPETLGAPVPTCVVTATGCAPGTLGESDLASSGDFSVDPILGKDGIKSQINVDWMVLAPGTYDTVAWDAVNGLTPSGAMSTVGVACPGCYLYLYQEENTNVITGFVQPGTTDACVVGKACVPSGINILGLTISPIPGKVLAIAGVFGANDGQYPKNATDDLDCGLGNPSCTSIYHPGHVIKPTGAYNPADDGVTTEATNASTTPHQALAGTEEEGPCPVEDTFGSGADTDGVDGHSFCINPADDIRTSFTGGGVTFTYTPPKPPHHETVTLFYASLDPPVYGRGSTQDTIQPWATGNRDPDEPAFTGNPIPVPAAAIPEPTTLVLFGGGLVTLGLLRRKMKR